MFYGFFKEKGSDGMNKFSYRMQNVLNIKSQLEEQEKINYSLANEKACEERERLVELSKRKAGYEAKARELISGPLDLQEIKECKTAINTMKSVVRTQMFQVHIAEKNLDSARNRLSDVMTERKMHEKLREHAFDAYRREYEAEEQKQIDERVSFTYGVGSDYGVSSHEITI
jgi:flagellar FliJ protein